VRQLPVIALALAGCLSVPTGQQAMCKSSSDCDDGEVCEMGTCWGDPPAGMFAATLGPPSDRDDVAPTELASLALPQDGWLGNVSLGAAITMSGRVEALCVTGANTCSTASIGAKLTVTRPSEFSGGPGFSGAGTAADGIARGTDSFHLAVPMQGPGDPPFMITVVPTGRDLTPPASGSSPAMVVPPMHQSLPASALDEKTFVLGSTGGKTLSGTLTDGDAINPHPLTKYRVVALGHWDVTGPQTEVSTVAYSTDGTFSLAISDDVAPGTLLEIMATPYDPSVVAPTLHLAGLKADSVSHTLAQAPAIGNRVNLSVPITGLAGDGSVGPVSGARVIVTSSYTPALGGVTSMLDVEATTGADGTAELTLLDGDSFAGSYRISVIPPASSSYGVIYQQPFALEASATPIRLPARVALSGVAVDSSGFPLGNVAVTAVPSLRFAWSLDSDAQTFLAEIPAATAVTTDNGDFVVWVDPFLANVPGGYQLTFEPPMGSRSAPWTPPEIALPPETQLTMYPLMNVTIPDAAFLHGMIVGPDGGPVTGAELRIYQVITDQSLCGTGNAPANCVVPAAQLGDGTSDATGTVALTLPRP